MSKNFVVTTPEGDRLRADQTIGPDGSLRLAVTAMGPLSTHSDDYTAYLSPEDALKLRDYLITFCALHGG